MLLISQGFSHYQNEMGRDLKLDFYTQNNPNLHKQAVDDLKQLGIVVHSKGPVTRCNFSGNLQRYSTLGRCKIGKYTFPS